MPTHSAVERGNLADAMLSAGPDSPTLCTGWTVRDLAAHVLTREWRPDAAATLLLPPLAGYGDAVLRRQAARPFEATVEKFRSGPPLLGWSNIPGVDANLNFGEFFVHHEDVRRAVPGWEPRQLPDDVTRRLWATLGRMGRMFYRRAGRPVTLEWASTGKQHTVGSGDGSADGVTLRGEPAELVMFSFGRRGAAHVTLEGPADGQERLRTMKLGI